MRGSSLPLIAMVMASCSQPIAPAPAAESAILLTPTSAHTRLAPSVGDFGACDLVTPGNVLTWVRNFPAGQVQTQLYHASTASCAPTGDHLRIDSDHLRVTGSSVVRYEADESCGRVQLDVR